MNYLMSDSDYNLLHQIANRIKPAGSIQYVDAKDGESIREAIERTNRENGAKRPTDEGSPTGFVWSNKSRNELVGVKKELVECATLALTRYTDTDFMCFDGKRSIDEQRKHVANGTSKTMKSKHLEGLAVDLVPIIGGIPKWDWEGCYDIACAMDAAATHLGIANHIRWGGAWDRTLADFGGDSDAYAREVQAYQKRHPGPDFIDGPHFEWVE